MNFTLQTAGYILFNMSPEPAGGSTLTVQFATPNALEFLPKLNGTKKSA
jgi:hypothetical protein